MKTLAVANQKGGVGKTNTSVHTAFDFMERKLRILFLDLDPQGNASFSLEQYKSMLVASDLFFKDDLDIEPNESGITLISGDVKLIDVEKMSISEVGNRLKNNLDANSHKFDVCIVDTGPTLCVRLTAALFVSDFVFSPIEVEAYSMLGVGLMKKTISNMSAANPDLVNLGLVPSRVDRRNPLHVRNLESLQKNHADQVMPVVIGQRTSVGEALYAKVPVWSIKKSSARVAAKELRALAEHLFMKMELN